MSARIALVAALAGPIGCGERPDDAPDATYPVAIERAAFPPRQRLGDHTTLELRIRNAGDRTIPDLVVTVRGFDDEHGRDLWLVDRPPSGTTATDATWAAGELRPGATRALRWKVTAVSAGTHELSYAIAPSLSGGDRARLRDGDDQRRRLTVRVSGRPRDARIDPRTGRVIRE